MAFLIDSDWLTEFLRDLPRARATVEPLAASGISISIISYMEVYDGIERDQPTPLDRQRIEALLDAMPILWITKPVAQRCAKLRNILRQRGRSVTRRSLDLLIAATAIEYDLTLVTRNRQDYADVPDLRVHETG